MTRFDPTRPVQTRDGHPARIICTDLKNDRYPIVALVVGDDGKEVVFKYRADGKFSVSDNHYMDLVNICLTSEEYVAKKGIICPVCGTDNISGGDTDFYEGGMSQQVSCDNCGAEWVDDYVLAGYSNLEINEEESE